MPGVSDDAVSQRDVSRYGAAIGRGGGGEGGANPPKLSLKAVQCGGNGTLASQPGVRYVVFVAGI